jgi:small-conductance mechanosensitive channel
MSWLSVASLVVPLLAAAADQTAPADPNTAPVRQLREELQREQTYIKQLEERLAALEAAQSTPVSPCGHFVPGWRGGTQ